MEYGLYDNVSLGISEESFFMNLDTQDFLKNTQDIPCLIRNIRFWYILKLSLFQKYNTLKD